MISLFYYGLYVFCIGTLLQKNKVCGLLQGNNTLMFEYSTAGSGFQYQYFTNPALDLSSYSHFHIDFYIDGTTDLGSVLQIFIQQFNASNGVDDSIYYNFDVYEAPATKTSGTSKSNLGNGTWYSGEVALADFTNGGFTKDNIKQIQIVAAGPVFSPVYIDNIYFYNAATASVEDNVLTSFNAYPNPTNDLWMVSSKDLNINTIQVFDILGKEVLFMTPNKREARIDGSNLLSGIYFARISNNTGSQTLKLVKR
ncbi:T9SS type A sorting domain-containing protein [Aestuariibaculum sediminum]|uniref:T9SS type A sorting domain-containing protein n=1 Tax=Aestuariibaculum sediminum TaxID=2770637 RepID=A0A8J6U8N2_9FLAO|nr:T9SS type A sorting domain-containing protein [Aestuariibaculum sediminum]MBD0831842.1 T9SS type A sorting domain-containing protein [Aestuariibaculum sediminum]